MHLSPEESFVISFVVTLIIGLYHLIKQGGDDDHNQGAGAVGCLHV